jgi:hypothetical protein
MRAPLVFAAWGLALAAVGIVGVAIFGFDGAEPPALFGGAAAVMVVVALYLRLAGLGRAAQPDAEAVTDLSPATVWLAVSVVLLAVGAELGLWLVLIAAGATAVGVGGLARELSAQRRAEQEASERGS